MKKFTLSIIATALSLAAVSQTTPHWLRKSSISPDGKTVAFAWQGDIFTVPVGGGQAKQITSNPAFDTDPIWTPDGSSIVFSSQRELSKDIWLISSEGGSPTRLTTYTGSETPIAVTPERDVVFCSDIQIDPYFGGIPGYEQLYKVSLEGGNIKQLYPFQAGNFSKNTQGVILYENIPGREDAMRKHHHSSVARDIWKIEDGSFTRLSTFEGEDRNPVFASDGRTYYFLSERSGSFNVWKGSIDGKPGEERQLTHFTTHPVRFLSAASDGTLCFSWNGDLYTMKEGGTPVLLDVTVRKDDASRNVKKRAALSPTGNIAVSPDGKELAFVSKGDVFVTSTEVRSIRRITNTPQPEKGVCFSGDGRSLFYASERDGEWAVWKSSLKNKADKHFSATYDFTEERFTEKGSTCSQPSVSPDGKWVAFLRKRSELVIKPAGGGRETVLLPENVNYSYKDGDLDFQWSPDSHHILTDYMGEGGWNNSDVAVIDIDSRKLTNLTCSGYSDGGFRWIMGGRGMTWSTDRQGYRSHGSWGAERDVYAMFFDERAYGDFIRSREIEKLEKFLEEDSGKKKEKQDSLKDGAAKSVKKVELDLENIEDRTLRLTLSSGTIGDHILSPDGEKLYYVVKLEKGRDLCCLDVKDRSIKVVKKGFSGKFNVSQDGRSVYCASLLGISKIDLSSGKTEMIPFSGEVEYNPAAEREYIFEHCWKQVDEKFYDETKHGVDWVGMGDNYRRFLPYIDNNFEFADMLSEMLGELNASHTGLRYRPKASLSTGHIGVLFDMDYEGEGLRIGELLPGGVLACAARGIEAGDIITAIDGCVIESGSQWFDVFREKDGKNVRLSIRKKGGKTLNVNLRPEKSDAKPLYRRWVRQRENMVEEMSGGRIGYVHIGKMDSPSYRELFSKALGKYRNCDALIVDTRHNGGGWLHDDLAVFLSGKAYLEWCPRGRSIGSEPYNRWTKPSCVLIGEDNYSDASGFPYIYRQLGIGKLVGAPVPGTMNAVWWEAQVDATLILGVPEVAGRSLSEGRILENYQVEPDIEVYNTPESLMAGKDLQLEAAVKELLKIDKNM